MASAPPRGRVELDTPVRHHAGIEASWPSAHPPGASAYPSTGPSSRRAIHYARASATPETEIVLCRIVRDPSPLVKLTDSLAFPIERIRAPKVREAEGYPDDVAAALRAKHDHIATASAVGSPPDEILRIAAEQNVDTIVMTTNRRGFLGRLVTGSVAVRVARAVDTPILLVRARGAARLVVDSGDATSFARLLVPLDGSGLARPDLPVATQLAAHLQIQTHLGGALPLREDIIPDDDTLSLDSYDDYVSAVAAPLRAEAAGLGTLAAPATSEVIGPPAEAVLESVSEEDVIVMTSHGHGGMRRWWIGSVAECLTHIGRSRSRSYQ